MTDQILTTVKAEALVRQPATQNVSTVKAEVLYRPTAAHRITTLKVEALISIAAQTTVPTGASGSKYTSIIQSSM